MTETVSDVYIDEWKAGSYIMKRSVCYRDEMIHLVLGSLSEQKHPSQNATMRRIKDVAFSFC